MFLVTLRLFSGVPAAANGVPMNNIDVSPTLEVNVIVIRDRSDFFSKGVWRFITGKYHTAGRKVYNYFENGPVATVIS